MPRIVEGNFTFVTNNARDFRKLYAKEELPAGVVIVVLRVLPARQREMFGVVLNELAKRTTIRTFVARPSRLAVRPHKAWRYYKSRYGITPSETCRHARSQ